MPAMKFAVHGVSVSTSRMEKLPPESIVNAWRKVGKRVVDCSLPEAGNFVRGFDTPNLLALSVYLAFYRHLPLKISPDAVWITIVQGFGQCVNADPEAARSVFVTHEGKRKLLVGRPDFRYGAKNDWASVCGDFAALIAKNTTPGTAEKLSCKFSTTSLTDACCGHIALMDTMKAFFEYEGICGCGIPWVELLGTAEDWVLLKQKVDTLAEFKLNAHFDTWMAGLKEISQQFVAAAQGHGDVAFWGSVCIMGGGSGMKGDPVSGWISGLFPMDIEGKPAYWLKR
jgi:hypothetical protein